jgi:hypothetical protein
MSLPRVPLDSSNERQHRTIIATTVNELVKTRPPFDLTEAESAAGIRAIDARYAPGNVLRYGADPDEVRDSTDALQAALDTNNVVYLPTGRYKTSATLNWHPNQRIYGDAHGKSVIAPTGSTSFFALEFDYENEASGPHGCVFENFHIDGTGMTGTTAESVGGIHWTGASHSSTIRNVRIRNFDAANQIGLYITGLVYYLSVRDVDIVDCVIACKIDGNNVTASQTPSANSITLENLRIESSTLANSAGISLENATHTRIIGGYIEQVALFGITADSDSDYTYIEGVWLEQIPGSDIRLNGCEKCVVESTYHFRTTSDTSNIAVDLANGGYHNIRNVVALNRTGATTTQPVVFSGTVNGCIIQGVRTDLAAGAANVYSGTIGSNVVIDANSSNAQVVSGVYRNFIGGVRIGDGTTNDVETLNSVLMNTKTWDPGSVATGSSTTTTVTVTGAALNDTVIPSFSLSLSGLMLTGYVSAADTVTVVLANNTAAAVDLGSGTLRAAVLKW